MSASQHPAGTFCWFECGTRDAAASKAFYTRLFGWEAADMTGEFGIYTLLKTADGDVAGLYQLAGPQFEGVPSHWLSYVAVDDVDAAARQTIELGGKVVMGPVDVPNVGRIAILKDPAEAVFGVSRFDQHPGTTPSGPFGWSELTTRDTTHAQDFYTSLFKWGVKPDPKHEYTEFQAVGKSVGGMMALTERHGGAPSHWMPYVMVQNCDTTARMTTELGGKLLVPPTDIENVGRFAVLQDPAGATLGVIQLERRS